ncbi:MAG: asparagine synthase (glutamine-hydrolyzing) [Acidobacteria bacterium]|nr:asparagine synthase (glutamine-hydrolyzing) [Acidobacteriota bacterium]
MAEPLHHGASRRTRIDQPSEPPTMCGIAGVIGGHPTEDAQAAVETMLAALAHRGPNGAGVECWSEAVLGHRRLAIFDLSDAGRQPMCTEDRRVAVVFNGAIYNFGELRAQLEGAGHRFRTRTDTEVLIHGFREWGIDELVARLRGMYAFVLWDDVAHRCYLVRDRLGKKPLYFAFRNGQLAFASTARALRQAGFAGDIDAGAVADFFEFGYVTERRCIYQGVEKVPIASIIEWRPGGEPQRRTYWHPPSKASSKRGISFGEAVERTEHLLLASTARRLQADVPVGALLSGGVDSGLVCWAVKTLGADVKAFTIGTPGHPADETSDAVSTARDIGIEHEVLELSSDVPADLSELIAAYGEPFACSSAIGMLHLSRAVARSATVLLTGDGGDDFFLGYPRHRYLRLAQSIGRLTPEVAGRGWISMHRGVRPRGPLRRLAHFIDYGVGGLGAFVNARDGLPAYRSMGILGERMRDASVAERSIPWSHDSGRRVLAEYLEHDRHGQFVAEYLTKVDGATMYHALEARAPFMDQELIEYAWSLPVDILMHGYRLKPVLRALAQRRIGLRVARGRKRGFTIPVEHWIAGPWRRTLEARLHESQLAREGWIQPTPLLRELASTAPGEAASQRLWYFFVLEEWLRAERATQGVREFRESRLATTFVSAERSNQM